MKKWASEILLFLISLLIAVLIFSLLSCSPQKRLNRILKKHPELRQLDTLTIRDTTVTERVQIDTLFKPGKDTTIFKEGKATVKFLYKKEIDTVFLDVICDADTIFKEIKVPVNIPHTEETTGEKLKSLWWVWLIIAGSLIAILVFKK